MPWWYWLAMAGIWSAIISMNVYTIRLRRKRRAMTLGSGGSGSGGFGLVGWSGNVTAGGNGGSTTFNHMTFGSGGGGAGGVVASSGSSSPALPPGMPRGSGSGMSGFAGQGQLMLDMEYEPEFDAKPVRGLRQWTLDGPDFRMDPMSAELNWAPFPLKGATGYAWPAGVQDALCNNGKSHEPPIESDAEGACGCGFWAYWDMTGMSAGRFSGSNGLPVIGIIEGYGRVLIGEKGFRSGKARIVALAPAFTVRAEVAPRASEAPSMSEFDAMMRGRALPASEAIEREKLQSQDDEYTAIARKAQSHADAWMAVIQDRIGEAYPGVQVYATVNGLLAAVPTHGKPSS